MLKKKKISILLLANILVISNFCLNVNAMNFKNAIEESEKVPKDSVRTQFSFKNETIKNEKIPKDSVRTQFSFKNETIKNEKIPKDSVKKQFTLITNNNNKRVPLDSKKKEKMSENNFFSKNKKERKTKNINICQHHVKNENPLLNLNSVKLSTNRQI